MTNQPATSILPAVDGTVAGRIYGHFSGKGSSTEMRLLLIVGLVIFVNMTVKIIRHNSEWLVLKRDTNHKKYPRIFRTPQSKFVTVYRLFVSAIIFVIYLESFFIFNYRLFRELNVIDNIISKRIIFISACFCYYK